MSSWLAVQAAGKHYLMPLGQSGEITPMARRTDRALYATVVLGVADCAVPWLASWIWRPFLGMVWFVQNKA